MTDKQMKPGDGSSVARSESGDVSVLVLVQARCQPIASPPPTAFPTFTVSMATTTLMFWVSAPLPPGGFVGSHVGPVLLTVPICTLVKFWIWNSSVSVLVLHWFWFWLCSQAAVRPLRLQMAPQAAVRPAQVFLLNVLWLFQGRIYRGATRGANCPLCPLAAELSLPQSCFMS